MSKVTQEDLNVIEAIRAEQSNLELQPIPDNGIFRPRKWQLEDLQLLLNRNSSANWSEMGCFKTSTLLWLIEQKLLPIERPRVLIVTTKSGKGTYFKHVPVMLPEWGLFNIHSTGVNKVMFGFEVKMPEFPQVNEFPMLCVAHYNCFTKRSAKDGIGKQLLEGRWDFIALDEAHRIKNPDTQWTQVIKKLRANYRHAMTGTGFINNPAEIWSLLNFLNQRQFPAYWKFRQEYCLEEDFSGYRKITGIIPGKKNEFRQLVRAYGPRRTKAEVFKNLDKPIFTTVDIDLNATQRRMFDEIKIYLRTLDKEGVPMHSPNVLAALTRLRQICVATPKVVREYFDEKEQRVRVEIQLEEPSSKLDALMDIIDGLEWDEERKDQIVVFSNFKGPIELAKARFDKAGISYLEMKQSDNDRVRYQKWAEIFPKKEHQVFICTLQLGSESIDLTSATTCVFLDRSWSPKDNEQGVSRVWRPGQQDVAHIINIEAKRTTDQRVFSTNKTKLGWFEEIFGAETE